MPNFESTLPAEELTAAKLGTIDRMNKQLKSTMATLGNMDERMNALEAMVLAALEKQQNDIKTLMIAVNASSSEKTARDKFDMDASPDTFNDPAQPPVG
jgi:hypothetical protein